MLDKLDKLIQDGVDRGLLQNFTSNEVLGSSEISIDESTYLNFGSCSYLGLEYHPKLRDAVKDAVDKFGTQFSTSRTYLSIGQYATLEKELSNMFDKPALVSSSTTLGHLAALPVIIEQGDVVILDLQVHSSVQMTAQILKANNIAVHLIPHNDMEGLEAKIKKVNEKAKKIWYLADGVYSMYGDFAPLSKLEKLLNKYKKLHLYIDDAHGMGWTGEKGTGYVRSQIKHHDKMVLATSLNKSFATSGGVLVFPNAELHRKVKNCGTTMIFSGPIQPPMLGAAIESAKLHQSDEFKVIQNELRDKISFTNKRLKELGLPQFKETASPLFFIPVGLIRVIRTIIKRMKKKGFYLNSAGFPATPMKKGGLRFMINNNLSYDQIDEMLTALKDEFIAGLIFEGSSPEYISKQFKIPEFLTNIEMPSENLYQSLGFSLEHFSSIDKIDRKEWDRLFSKYGTNEYNNLKKLELVFNGHELPEYNWDINYHIIRDDKGAIILASVYSISIMMEDLLEEKSISEKIKEIREHDKYYLTSSAMLTGTPFTKGRSVYVNFEHNDWKEAVKLHVEKLQEIAEDNEVSKIIYREFSESQKQKLEPILSDLGLLELDLPNTCVVEDMSWNTKEDLLKKLSQKYRYSLRKEILKKEDLFEVSYERPTSKEAQEYIFKLYKNVHNGSTEISVFELPYELFSNMFQDPSYDFISLYLKDGPDKPVAIMLSQIIDGVYNAQLVGLDYKYVREQGTYKQILYQTVMRAKELNCEKIDLAYTAEMEKKKVGAITEKTFAFIMAFEHDSYAEMQLLK